jgi:hypothetical protein
MNQRDSVHQSIQGVACTAALGVLVILAVVSLLLAGCAPSQATLNKRAVEAERILAAAGFQMKFADTPELLTKLQAMPQRTLVPHKQNGALRYVYADATSCKCLYAGSEKAYQRYQQLALKHQEAQDRLQAAKMNAAASMDWGAWGAWAPWW